MRLIDADKLDLVVHVPSQNNAVCQQIADEVGRQIANAPTVDAIPKEWIKKYIDKADKEDWGMVYLSPSGPFRDMLKVWEEKNDNQERPL